MGQIKDGLGFGGPFSLRDQASCLNKNKVLKLLFKKFICLFSNFIFNNSFIKIFLIRLFILKFIYYFSFLFIFYSGS